jgi:hypothetical protein
MSDRRDTGNKGRHGDDTERLWKQMASERDEQERTQMVILTSRGANN